MEILVFWNMAPWVLLCIYVRKKIDEAVFILFHGQDGDSKLLRNVDTYGLIS
jgi:hypothetical protein